MKPSHLAVALALAGAVSAAAPAPADDLEVAVFLGQALPTYEQSFRYDPGLAPVVVPGLSLEQNGVFELDGRGGLVAGAAVTWYVLGSTLGIEGRVDTADVDVRTTGARFTARADLPAPLPDLTTDLELGTGTVDLERLRPLSLNLKLKTPGPLRLTASAGVSYLPELNVTVTQNLGLGVVGLGAGGRSLTVPTVAMRAEATPNEDGSGGRLGANAGAGLQLSLLPRVALSLDARVFLFKKHTLRWEPTSTGPRSALEQALVDELERRLDPVEFHPTFYQATAGITVTF